MKTIKKPLVGIILGSDSDFPVIESALSILDDFNVRYEVIVSSAHRTPARTEEYVRTSSKRGIKVLIAAAGGAAHLPGVVAAYTNLPVIGIPIKTKSFDGIDSLLSIIEMPKGVPVATVGVNNAENAVLLALRILACSDTPINRKMTLFRKKQEKSVIKKDAILQGKLKTR